MDRKKFLTSSLILGCLGLFHSKTVRAASDEEAGQAKIDPNQQFRENWLRSLMDHMGQSNRDSSMLEVLEACGRDCAKRGPIQLANENKGNVDGMLSALAAHLGEENAKRDGSTVTLKYPKCYCPMVSGMKEKISGTWCECSRGWVVQMFETAAEKPVDVTLIRSIIRGDEVCEFKIQI